MSNAWILGALAAIPCQQLASQYVLQGLLGARPTLADKVACLFGLLLHLVVGAGFTLGFAASMSAPFIASLTQPFVSLMARKFGRRGPTIATMRAIPPFNGTIGAANGGPGATRVTHGRGISGIGS